MQKKVVWLWLIAVLAVGCEANSSVADKADATAADTSAPFDLNKAMYVGEQSGASARYDLAASDWHALPFPSDTRLNADGSVDLSGFPAARDGDTAQLLKDYLGYVPAAQKGGFSIQPTLYVQFDAPLDKTKLLAPQDTGKQFGAYFLTGLDPQSPDYGQPIPVRAALSPTTRGQHLLPNLLMIQPIWGRPLLPSHRYGLVVRRSLRDASGKILAQPPIVAQVVSAWRAGADPAKDHPELAKLAAALKPLHQAMLANKVPVAYDDIAAMTVFTTANPAQELVDLAQWVRAHWKPKAAANWKINKKTNNYWMLEASYPTPNFQKGQCPYDAPGSGGLAYDANGGPIIDHEETLRVSVMLPVMRGADVAGKTPMVLSAHGTGGNFESYAQGGPNDIANYLAVRGLAIASIDQPLHGPRCSPELTDMALGLKTFNYTNMVAGRGGFRQSALDSVVLTQMALQGLLDPPAELSPKDAEYHFDANRVSFIGHSQGGISGALVVAIEPALKAFVLSGAGAGLSLTIMQRVDPLPIAELITKMLHLDDGELSEFHPAVSLVQTLADVVDPLAYGYLATQRKPGVRPPHILLTEGLKDVYTPADTSEALAACIGLDVLSPLVHASDAMEFRGTQTLVPPVTGNQERNGFATTLLLSQWTHDGHFAIFDQENAAWLYSNFLLTTAKTLDATADFPN